MKKYFFISCLFLIFILFPIEVNADTNHYCFGPDFRDCIIFPIDENGNRDEEGLSYTLDDFDWSKSMFGRNGSNVKSVKFFVDSLAGYSYSDINVSLSLKYKGALYGKYLNDSESTGYYSLSKTQTEVIKKILFDRDIGYNNDNRVGLYIVPQRDIEMYDNPLRYGFSLEFHSAQEIIVESFLISYQRIQQQWYYHTSVVVSFYDAYGELIASLSDANVESLNICDMANRLFYYKVPKRLSEVYRVDISFSSKGEWTGGWGIWRKGKAVRVYLDEFNIFSTDRLIKMPYYEDSEASYSVCAWNDITCHIRNFFEWFIYDNPLIKTIRTFFDLIVGGLNSFSYVLNAIFLPLLILPKVNGVDFSVIVPAFVIFIILYKWFVG